MWFSIFLNHDKYSLLKTNYIIIILRLIKKMYYHAAVDFYCC